jgi:hypothetical protein
MTMPELLLALNAAAKAARDRGASDAEVDQVRRDVINANCQKVTSQEYRNAWTPGIPPVPQQKPLPLNPGRTYSHKSERF